MQDDSTNRADPHLEAPGSDPDGTDLDPGRTRLAPAAAGAASDSGAEGAEPDPYSNATASSPDAEAAEPDPCANANASDPGAEGAEPDPYATASSPERAGPAGGGPPGADPPGAGQAPVPGAARLPGGACVPAAPNLPPGFVSPRIYWWRRALALAVGMVVLAILAWALNGAMGGGAAPG